MSLHKYEVFTKVLETGSLTKAGEHLGLTQSAVSHAIASLEQEYGLTLMTRGRSGISLTSNGERLYAYMREILRVNEQLMQEVAAIKGIESGTIKLGTFTSVSTQWLPGILKHFQGAYPNIEIKLFEGYYDEIEEWVAAGRVDLGFVSMPTETSIELFPLKKDRMLLLVPADHPLAARELVRVRELAEETFIMPTVGCDNDIQRILKAYDLVPNIKYELGDDHAIIAMVQSGLGITILPEMILFRLPPNIRVIPLEGAHYRTIGIGASSMAELTPAAQRFLTCVQDWVRDYAASS